MGLEGHQTVGAETASTRQHYWDSLRAFLMLLGIPYHTMISYRPGQTWIVRSDEGVAAFTWLAEIIHYFRMPAFFLIAGYFSALLLARRMPGQWLKNRFTRLAIPFITSILTLVPLMNLACEFSNLPYSEALSSFIWNSTHSGGYWVRHLWFIIVLLYLCSAVAALCHWFPRLRSMQMPGRADAWIGRHAVPLLLMIGVLVGIWEGVAVEYFYIWGLATNVPQQILRLDELIIYTPWFVLGLLLQRSPAGLERYTRFSRRIAVFAAISLGLSLAYVGEVHPALGRFIATFAALTITQLLIAGARSLLDRPSPLVSSFTDASFVIYLFHMPIIVALVWLGQDVPVPTLVKALAVMTLSLALSYGAWKFIAASPRLAVSFNGVFRPPGKLAAA